MHIDFLTIFPDIFDSYLKSSIMKRAHNAKHVSFKSHDIRDFSTNKHRNVDDTPYGGGAGMVMQVEPIYNALEHLKKNDDISQRRRVVLLSAKGKQYTQKDAVRLATYDHIIFVCGRYEGVDERVAQHLIDEEIAIGEYVLTGGELGALVVTDSVVRLLPGVLGNEESIVHESHIPSGYREHPHYSKPEEFHGWCVPDVLLSGNHKAIAQWRDDHADHIQKK